jgi:hypothetical protein
MNKQELKELIKEQIREILSEAPNRANKSKFNKDTLDSLDRAIKTLKGSINAKEKESIPADWDKRKKSVQKDFENWMKQTERKHKVEFYSAHEDPDLVFRPKENKTREGETFLDY